MVRREKTGVPLTDEGPIRMGTELITAGTMTERGDIETLVVEPHIEVTDATMKGIARDAGMKEISITIGNACAPIDQENIEAIRISIAAGTIVEWRITVVRDDLEIKVIIIAAPTGMMNEGTDVAIENTIGIIAVIFTGETGLNPTAKMIGDIHRITTTETKGTMGGSLNTGIGGSRQNIRSR